MQLSSQTISCNFGRVLIPAAKPKTFTAVKSVMDCGPPATKISDPPVQPVVRRTGNYKPCIWDNDFIQSLKSDYRGERFNVRASELKEAVKLMFKNAVVALDQLELIDHLQRLGLAYHFREEISHTLNQIGISTNYNDKYREKNNLYATALRYRLLGQHGYHISSEIFEEFTENESFKECIGEDVKGMLGLYEASYFSMEGEALMEEAWSFTSKTLQERVDYINDSDLAKLVRHGLELPLQWRSPRFEARWYIQYMCESNYMQVPAPLLELAKLDFNIVQAINQEELNDLSRWWNRTYDPNKLGFVRDRLPTSFLWSVGMSNEPKHQYFRVQFTKATQLITLIDDVYDIYATLDELELFTNVVERWDIDYAMNDLPDYMKICFLSLYNFVNEIVYDILKEQNLNILPHMKKAWINLLNHYLVEARWYHSGYKPTLEEYLSNGVVSVSMPLLAIQTYIFSSNPINKNEIEFIEDLPDIVRLAAETLRLADDYGTSGDELKRGDVPKSIQCYMLDTGVSEEIARQRMMYLMRKNWAKMIKSRFLGHDNPLHASFVEMILDLVRTSHCMYNAGVDGFGVEDGITKDRLFSLFCQPIPLE